MCIRDRALASQRPPAVHGTAAERSGQLCLRAFWGGSWRVLGGGQARPSLPLPPCPRAALAPAWAATASAPRAGAWWHNTIATAWTGPAAARRAWPCASSAAGRRAPSAPGSGESSWVGVGHHQAQRQRVHGAGEGGAGAIAPCGPSWLLGAISTVPFCRPSAAAAAPARHAGVARRPAATPCAWWDSRRSPVTQTEMACPASR